ncbi:YSIRK-type signal peptide-containing protein [Lactobacillus sp. HT06-2]|uniref:YSIRK-type signal peptide-containing protein n=1 Tax=Lactobacillus sp. HT06-2 TaxID=2080222 RepID=UPI000CD86BDE|nr:YSIRK-type signal peptide-containing protein [Lactobacillus sp. HT06-2]
MLLKDKAKMHYSFRKLTIGLVPALLGLGFLNTNVQAAENEDHLIQNTKRQQNDDVKFTTKEEILDKINKQEPVDLNDPNAPVDPTDDPICPDYVEAEMVAKVKRQISVRNPQQSSDQEWSYTAPDRDQSYNDSSLKNEPNKSLTDLEKKNDAGQIIYLVRGGKRGSYDDFWHYDTDWIFGTITFTENNGLLIATATPYSDGGKIEFKDWLIPEIDQYTPESKKGIDHLNWQKADRNIKNQAIVKGQSFTSVEELENNIEGFSEYSDLYSIKDEDLAKHFGKKEERDSIGNTLTEANHYFVRYVIPKEEPKKDEHVSPESLETQVEPDSQPTNPNNAEVPDPVPNSTQQHGEIDIPKTPKQDSKQDSKQEQKESDDPNSSDSTSNSNLKDKQHNISKSQHSALNSERIDQDRSFPSQEKLSSSVKKYTTSTTEKLAKGDAQGQFTLPRAGSKQSKLTLFGLAFSVLPGLLGLNFSHKRQK